MMSNAPPPESSADSVATRGTRALLRAIYHAPYLSLLICLLITTGAALAGMKLKGNIRTKLEDLLPDHAPSVIASRSLGERLDSVDMLVMTLMTDDFDRVKRVLPQLKTRLESLDQVRAVEWRQDTTLIERNALITFPTLVELKDAYADLRREIRKAVSERMNLFDDDDDAALAQEGRSPTRDDRIRVGLIGEERAVERGFLKSLDKSEGVSYAWGELEVESPLSDIGAQLRALKVDYPEHFHNAFYNTIGLKIYPAQSSSDLQFCQQLIDAVTRESHDLIERELGPIAEGQVIRRFDLGGAYVNTLRASKKIKRDMFGSTVSSLALLAITLLVAFRSLRGMICVLIPLVIGTVWTVGVTALTVGYLNLITAFIFAVLLGLGIDFGIHFYGRFREERALGFDAYEAMERAHLSCGHASVLAASTTAAAFFALTLADFRGLSQFGGLAAMGVLLCLLSVFIVLPIIVFIWERWLPLNLLGYTVEPLHDPLSQGGLVRRLGARVAIIGIAIGLAGVALAPLVERELNFNKLKAYPKPAASMSADEVSTKRLQYGTTRSTSPTVVFAKSPKEAKHLQRQLRALSDDPDTQINSVQSLYSLIPDEQAERIKWARKLCRKLKRKYKLFKGDARAGAEELLSHCDPYEFTERDLPPWVKAKFTDRRGVVGGFLFVSPRGSSSDGERAIAFYEEMQGVKTLDGEPPMVAGRSMVWAEILIAMRRDGAITFSAALILVLIILAALERSWRGLWFVSTPLILGLGGTIAAMVTLGIKLNFFNLLALPTLIGMGVDDGVHMHHRYRELGPNSSSYIVRTTGRAAFLTTLTTSIGFASLMLVDHRGLNSLGLLSVIGMSCALLATLIIVPALFNWWDARCAQRAALSDAKPHLSSSSLVNLMSFIIALSLIHTLNIGCDSNSTPGFEGVTQASRRDAGVKTDDLSGDTSGVDAPLAGAQRYAGSSAGEPAGEMSGGAGDAGAMMGAGMTPHTAGDERTAGARGGEEGAGSLTNPEADCASACDCARGLSCIDQVCVLDQANLVYCCSDERCPSGSVCEHTSGERSTCAEPVECASACDCFAGFTCEAGLCELPATGAPLVLCCERDCSPLNSDVACEVPGEARQRCP